MADTTDFVCIGCPIGCPLQLEHQGQQIVEVSGNECKRGAKYARQEFVDPRRELSTTVAITGALWRRLPVKTTGPVPKERIMEAARAIHQITTDAPVRVGEVLIEDLLGEAGLRVVATRSMVRIDPADSTDRADPTEPAEWPE